jgi:hypothetical protein
VTEVNTDATRHTVDDLAALERLIGRLSPEKRAKLAQVPEIKDRLAQRWIANPGPQTLAFESLADELFYGGQAGGGKTDLLCGAAITAHSRSLILRRTNKEASKLVERFTEILGSRDGYNGQEHVWRLDDRIIDISGCQHEDDKQKFKGTPHDFIGFDEVSDFTESQFRFINAWNRSADHTQRCRVIAAGNPPTNPEGLWVLKYWAPWIDPSHPNPAKPGELRWFTTINGEDCEVDGAGPHDIDGEQIMARSRTFIPAKLSDNPDLAATNYASVLAGLPPELRSAYKEGKFDAALKDNPFQVIPTRWILEAQARWKPEGFHEVTMTAMALDPAGGGADAEELVWRHGGWISEPITAKGSHTKDGSRAAGMIAEYRRHQAPVIVDVGGGYGGAVVQRLQDNAIQHYAFNGANSSIGKTRDGKLAFVNKRAEAWWRMREELDPDQEGGSVIALPPGAEVRADLAAPHWKLTARGIQLESKEDIRARIGRSPGKGDAMVMVLTEGQAVITRELHMASKRGAAPKIHLGYANAKKARR